MPPSLSPFEEAFVVSDRDIVWRQCVRLGRYVLPLLDQEPWRQVKRHERLHAWQIDLETGESLIATFAALELHAVVADAIATGSPRSIAMLNGIPLAAVVEATASKHDYEILAAIPAEHTDETEKTALNYFRLLSYQTGPTGLWLPRLRTELRHALITLAERSRLPAPTCGDLGQWAEEAGLG
ncbi:hypothetical protein ACFXKR_18300 [Streptomyces violascens]|uniref:hypothetical protein n=1 Tax=Streptomyces violascens TaxID=67381 RepID=UPI0036B3D2A3